MRIILSALLCLCVAFTAFAQQLDNEVVIKQHKKLKQRFEISYGYITRDQALKDIFPKLNKVYLLNDSLKYRLSTARTNQLFGFNDKTVRYDVMSRSGAFSFTYRARLAKWLYVGAAFAYERHYAGLTLGNANEKIGDYKRIAFTIAPECQFIYKKHKYITVYGILGLGNTFVTETYAGTVASATDKSIYFACQVSPFAIRVGRQFSGFLETGFGYKGLINGGVSYLLR